MSTIAAPTLSPKTASSYGTSQTRMPSAGAPPRAPAEADASSKLSISQAALDLAASASAGLELTPGALKKMAQLGLSAGDQQQFKTLLGKAAAEAAASDPQAFLRTLTSAELGILQKVHSLADAPDPASLPREGAFNLLQQPGSEQDLDNNGLTMVGAAATLVFPPQNAPQRFKDAWAAASADLPFGSIPAHMALGVLLSNTHLDQETGQVTQYSPGDPRWVNPYASAGFDYGGAVKHVMDGLSYQFNAGLGKMSPEHYQADMAFYGRVLSLMKAGEGS